MQQILHFTSGMLVVQNMGLYVTEYYLNLYLPMSHQSSIRFANYILVLLGLQLITIITEIWMIIQKQNRKKRQQNIFNENF